MTRAAEIVARIDREGDADVLAGAVTPDMFSRYQLRDKPWRDPERLERARDECDTELAMADRLGCNPTTIRRWLAILGIEPPRPQHDPHRGLAQQLREMDPDDLEGSA